MGVRSPQRCTCSTLLKIGLLSRFVEAAPPALVARLFGVVRRLGSELGLEECRAVVNAGPAGGQTVGHLHEHLWRQMHWPPG